MSAGLPRFAGDCSEKVSADGSGVVVSDPRHVETKLVEVSLFDAKPGGVFEVRVLWPLPVLSLNG